MQCESKKISYKDTGYFTRLITDYQDRNPALDPFISFLPTIEGVSKAMEARDKFDTNREVLVDRLKEQYDGVTATELITSNIESLLSPDTYTITTAHQNNIFTGPLYFIYKIMHAIKLAADLKEKFPKKNFVPVYYMGSEDADLDELNHIHLNGDRLQWDTSQTGAVGRMVIDKSFVALIERMNGELSVLPHGNDIISLLKNFYSIGKTIEVATFEFVNELFNEYGLIVLLPDHHSLKKQMTQVFEDDLLRQSASSIVTSNAEKLSSHGYKVQANPREINLFYLKGDLRKRIMQEEGMYHVQDSSLKFPEEEIIQLLKEHPEEFSPNVILRGLYQETILPNIIFIGGGGEIAYWLQLKTLFAHYKVPFPILLIRNSFLFIEKKWEEKIERLGVEDVELFQSADAIMKLIVQKNSNKEIKLNGSLGEIDSLYDAFKKQASDVDPTLGHHVEALRTKTVFRLKELEKKMFRAEKRKFEDKQHLLQSIKNHLFPGASLQERYDNIAYYYAIWGRDWLRQIYDLSPGLESGFMIASCD